MPDQEPYKLSRRELLRMGALVAARALSPKFPILPVAESPAKPEKAAEKKHQFLNGRCLLMNHHGLLFLPDSEIISRDIGYATSLGAKVIRVFATDNNFGNEWTGERVGQKIAEIAPTLRAHNAKLIVALVNNHRPVPGEKKEAFGFFDRYDQLTQAFYEGIWKGAYKKYTSEIIQTVKNLGCRDVIFAWEPVNEGHTPQKPGVFLQFFKDVVASIRTIDGKTMIAPGTMGIHHLDPWQPNSKFGLEFYRYLKTIGSFVTLHAYDLIIKDGQVVENGDMPVHWDLDLLAKHPEMKLPIVVEEIGTSKNTHLWGDGQQDKRYLYETRAIRYLLQHGAVGFGPWSGCVDAKWGDTWRGISSFGSPDESISRNWQSQSLRANLERAYMGLPKPP